MIFDVMVQQSYTRQRFSSAGSRFFECAVSYQTITPRAMTLLKRWLTWNASNTKPAAVGGETIKEIMFKLDQEYGHSFKKRNSCNGVLVGLIKTRFRKVFNAF